MLKKFAKFEEILLVWSLVIMVALIFGQVVGRKVFESAPSWTEEMARYIHIFQVWIGASYSVKLRQHIRVEAFVTRFHGTFRQVLETISILIWFVMALFLAVFGTELVLSSIEHGQLAPAMQIPVWIAYLAIPLGGLGMAIRLIVQLVEVWKGNYDKPADEEIIA
ncbi:TRAP transporter small permease [Psychrobacillus sp. FJAT-21963]|uniref:TRAP transporter small permease n=2 Tax=Bacillaceae TaxID=186817 RepID=UPI0006B01261|nr:TRAP transporter small permease [Psychrobacillus sp. FJAT-21963]ALC88191.1 C4-dicarboxylate ABC transporter permease [Bacillus sp. FJAT-22090]KQL36797.1 C4-dicarboxylate ABC transporter permease [Psychrobacillus sp. FJAT-21963]